MFKTFIFAFLFSSQAFAFLSSGPSNPSGCADNDVATYLGGSLVCSAGVPAAIAWGGIAGLLSNQLDLQAALNAKQDSLGFTAENVANKDTDSTMAANSDVKYPSQKAVKTALATKEPTITAGLASQYYRGDKTMQTLDTLACAENTNLYFTPARTLAVPITGFVAGAGVVAATDTILQAFNKLAGNQANFELLANKDTDGTLAANSDVKYPSQKATKTYVDTGLATKQNSLGYVPEDVANKDTDATMAANSDVKYPSQKAVKTALATKEPTITAGLASQYYRGDKTMQTLDTLACAENTNLYFTPARTLLVPITGYVAGAGALAATDTLLQAFNKIGGNASTYELLANKDTDGTLAANSDVKYPSQKATKTYVDTGLATKQNSLGFTAEDVANKDTDATMAANSDVKYPSQKAVKTALATKEPTIATGTTLQYIRGDKSLATLDTIACVENTNLYFTPARTLAVPLTGFVAGAGTVAATDTILQGFNKLAGNTTSLQTQVNANATNFYLVDTVGGSDVTGTGSPLKPYRTLQAVATLIGSAASNAEFNDATKSFYYVKVIGSTTEATVTFGTRPHIMLDMTSGVLVGDLVIQYDQGAIFGANNQQPRFTIQGADLRAGYNGIFGYSGINGNVFHETVGGGSSMLAQLHLINTGVTGDVHQRLGTGGGGITLGVFLSGTLVSGKIISDGGAAGVITLYANNSDGSSSRSIGGATGPVQLYQMHNVRFVGACVVTGPQGGRWFDVQFGAFAHDFTGSTGTTSMDANTYESWATNVTLQGTVATTLLDTSRGVKYTATTAGDWPVVPTTVLGGLDQLASTRALKTRTINTTAPITGGGDLSVDRTFAMPASDATHDGYLTMVDWGRFDTAVGGGVTSVASANGFAGTILANVLTLQATQTGIQKSNGTALATAVSGTDYSGGTSGLATGILKSTTGTGALTIAVAGDFPTLNQNTTGTAANLSGTPVLPNGTTATTQAASDNSTKLATTAYADNASSNASVISKVLTGFVAGAGAVTAADTILSAFDKVVGNIATKLSSTLTTNHIFVGVAGVATDVAMSGGATIDATGNVLLDNASVTGQPITGYSSSAGAVAATDTILQAINKLNGNSALKVTAVSVASSNGFAGSSSGGTTPALTISTSVTGITKGNGTALSAAVAGTDYECPMNVVTKVANYTALPGDVIFCDATGGNVTITFPVAATTLCSIKVKKKDNSANVCNLAPNGADTIEHQAAQSLTSQDQGFSFISDKVSNFGAF